MTVRVGVIGAGVMGADHAHTLARFVRGAEVSLIADVDLGRATATSAVDGWADPQAILLRASDGVLAVVEVFLNAGYG